MTPIKLHIETAKYNIEQANKLMDFVDEDMHEYVIEIILYYIQKAKIQLDMANLYIDKE